MAFVAPLISIFLVLRNAFDSRYLAVSLAGIAIGLLFGLNPILTALGVTVVSSLGIERLRDTKRIYGESALALFLSGSLALAIVLLSLAKGFNTNLFSYLFGSIVTVTTTDVYTMGVLAIIVSVTLLLFYKELVYITFDEEAARVSGLPTKLINAVLIILAAFTVSLSIPVVGVLLIAALIVVPVVASLQLKKSFSETIFYAELISVLSVIAGIITSFYFNLSTGGTIVLVMLAVFLVLFMKNRKN